MIRMGVIGYGYWGPNIVRNFSAGDGCRVVGICDGKPEALKRASKAYPQVKVTSDYEELLSSADIEAIAIITPVFTHFEIAKKALLHGKHVFVEKPFTYNASEAEELVDLADKKNLKVMDTTAISLCMNNSLPIVVFNIRHLGNIKKVILGDPIGTIVRG